MKNTRDGLVALLVLAPVLASAAIGQNARRPVTAKIRSAIFAVIDDGKTVEPIALIDQGKLVSLDGEGEDSTTLAKSFYKTGTKYELIFGGAANGTVTIGKSNVGTECGGSSAEVSVRSARSLKGFVMGLATDLPALPKSSGLRRTPTAGERAEIEGLVRSEYAKKQVARTAYRQLHFYNLTAVDVDNDGIVELIGTYWIAPKATERDQLFFVAEKSQSGKYSLTYSEFNAVKAADVMSGNIKDIDTLGGELLVDLLDYDGDGVSEIFTIGKAFEGNNYYVYKRTEGKWSKVHETYDYRCGY